MIALGLLVRSSRRRTWPGGSLVMLENGREIHCNRGRNFMQSVFWLCKTSCMSRIRNAQSKASRLNVRFSAQGRRFVVARLRCRCEQVGEVVASLDKSFATIWSFSVCLGWPHPVKLLGSFCCVRSYCTMVHDISCRSCDLICFLLLTVPAFSVGAGVLEIRDRGFARVRNWKLRRG